MKSSWRTGILGIALILQALANVVVALLDGDSSTNPDWAVVGLAITAGWQGLVSRDNKVSDQKAGVRPEVVPSVQVPNAPPKP